MLGAVILLAACSKAKGLAPLYCEGGIIKGQGSGDCMAIMTEDAGASTAFFTNHPEHRYTLKPNGKGHYHLLLGGVVEGAMDVDDDWIHVILVSDGRKHNFRSDPPGFLN
jgi:hypothetical protein